MKQRIWLFADITRTPYITTQGSRNDRRQRGKKFLKMKRSCYYRPLCPFVTIPCLNFKVRGHLAGLLAVPHIETSVLRPIEYIVLVANTLPGN